MGFIHRQVIIAGAGIAGLWTLRRLLAAGYDAILLEREAIGAGQTLGAQGILHGGVKYGLDGSNRDIAARLRELPPLWHECLAGNRSPSLAEAGTLSPCQHLWAAGSWLSQVGATVGVRAMQGEVRKLDRETWPAALRDGGHKGAVYELRETVLEVKSVLRALAAPVRDRIFHSGPLQFEMRPDGGLAALACGGARLTADVFLFTAATGNEAAAEALGLGRGVAQRRPLKQIMVRGRLPPLYGHGVTVSPKPVATITSHPLEEETVWYLGGGVAEEGASMTDEAAVTNARRKLSEMFPAFDFSSMLWACWTVDRAEPNAASRLPDGPALLEQGNAALAWPAKLVYAPALAEKALDFTAARLPAAFDASSSVTAVIPPSASVPLPLAEMGTYPWDTADWRPAVREDPALP
ncbi:MAG: FAD-dependent oxidoreductase [Verrucomicrobiales bacterium]|nr:FAD-dependent oxidoreductase [Verrucomicrobiales bacterium]